MINTLFLLLSLSYVCSANVETQFRMFSLKFADVLRMGNFLPPPAAARALGIVHSCGYDAWSVFHSEVRMVSEPASIILIPKIPGYSERAAI